MEVVVYTFVIAIWWVLSFSVLFPLLLLLHFNKSFRDNYFANIFAKLIAPLCVQEQTLMLRNRHFAKLEEVYSKRDKSVPLEVLEIGIGAGANLQYYPENSNLTALDMNPYFFKLFLKNQSQYPQVNFKRSVLNMAENMRDVEDSSFDLVISTSVLCSVLSLESVLKEVKRVLKPGGKFLFMEHQAYPKNSANYLIQAFANPLWKVFFDGCDLLRNIEDPIREAGFSDVAIDHYDITSLWLMCRPHVFGIVTK